MINTVYAIFVHWIYFSATETPTTSKTFCMSVYFYRKEITLLSTAYLHGNSTSALISFSIR